MAPESCCVSFERYTQIMYNPVVPHILGKDCIILKTIIPSRKATKDYHKEREQKS
jgi:hypothetical protein